jgi:hypothetical protein
MRVKYIKFHKNVTGMRDIDKIKMIAPQILYLRRTSV